jgi:tRNA pseudouridine55 synthase
MPPRQVTVHRFEEIWREGERAEYEIECESGTYVRSLIADLGDAYCLELRRTAIGPFAVDEAADASPIPLADALARLREFENARVRAR